MNVTVVGTGYVGLVTGACLADAGNNVFCLDVDHGKIKLLNENKIPIFEPGLEPIVRRNREAGRLKFSTDVAASVAHAELQLIAVGTPPGEDGSADMQYVLAAAQAIAKHMTSRKVVATKSTVPVGTGDRIGEAMRKLTNHEFAVVSNPEFLKEGAAVEDFTRPDRVIIGAEDERAVALLRQLYAPFQRNHERIMVMSVRSAELTKYAANAMLATRISFMNELANLAEDIGADIEEVRRGIGSDPRIGYQFLYPGAGFGGSCFPKDVKALQRTATDAGRPLRVLGAVEDVNEAQKHVLGGKIGKRLGNLKGKCVAVWGLAFKANTDDMRGGEPHADRRPDGRRRQGARLRSGCRPRGEEDLPERQKRAHCGLGDGRARGRRRAGGGHRVAGVPQPRFRRHQGQAEDAGGVRRA